MGRVNETAPKRCRGCGKEILIIRTGSFYGRVIVEAEPVWIRQESGGGSVLHGRRAGRHRRRSWRRDGRSGHGVPVRLYPAQGTLSE